MERKLVVSLLALKRILFSLCFIWYNFSMENLKLMSNFSVIDLEFYSFLMSSPSTTLGCRFWEFHGMLTQMDWRIIWVNLEILRTVLSWRSLSPLSLSSFTLDFGVMEEMYSDSSILNFFLFISSIIAQYKYDYVNKPFVLFLFLIPFLDLLAKIKCRIMVVRCQWWGRELVKCGKNKCWMCNVRHVWKMLSCR